MAAFSRLTSRPLQSPGRRLIRTRAPARNRPVLSGLRDELKVQLLRGCRHAQWKVEGAGEDRNGRTAGRIFEDLAVLVARVAAVEKAFDDPRLGAIAGPTVGDRVLQCRLGPADGVPIRRVRELIEDRQIGAVPLHGSGKLNRIAGRDRLEGLGALRKFDEREARAIAGKAVGEEVALGVVTVEELFIQWSLINGAGAFGALVDHDVAAALSRRIQNADGKVAAGVHGTAGGHADGIGERLDRRFGRLVLGNLSIAPNVPHDLLSITPEHVGAALAAVARDLTDLLDALGIVEDACVAAVIVEDPLVVLRLRVVFRNKRREPRQRIEARSRYQPSVHG